MSFSEDRKLSCEELPRHFRHLLVTGACGFIGSHFVRLALAQDAELRVTVLDKFSYAANPRHLPLDDSSTGDRLTLIKGSITDEKLLNELFSKHKDIDGIVNFAAESSNDRAFLDPLSFTKTNLYGAQLLMSVAAQRRIHFHQVSTDEVFGDLPLDSNERFTEVSAFAPTSPYSSSKAAADLYLRGWEKTYGLSWTSSHASNTYGPCQHVLPTVAGLGGSFASLCWALLRKKQNHSENN